MSVLGSIIDEIKTRSASITSANGYAFDVGSVYGGRYSLDEEADAFPAVIVAVTDVSAEPRDNPTRKPSVQSYDTAEITVTIIDLLKDQDGRPLLSVEPLDRALELRAAVMQAITTDAPAAGQTREIVPLGQSTFLPEPGSSIVAVELRYNVSYADTYGHD